MNNENQNRIAKLEKQVMDLQKEISQLKETSSIPYEISGALEGRDFLTTFNPEDAPSGAEIAGHGFIDEIGLTGEEQTISIPAFPTKFLKVKSKNYQGTPIYIPIFFL
jgi:hypothetical protein